MGSKVLTVVGVESRARSAHKLVTRLTRVRSGPARGSEPAAMSIGLRRVRGSGRFA